MIEQITQQLDSFQTALTTVAVIISGAVGFFILRRVIKWVLKGSPNRYTGWDYQGSEHVGGNKWKHTERYWRDGQATGRRRHTYKNEEHL